MTQVHATLVTENRHCEYASLRGDRLDTGYPAANGHNGVTNDMDSVWHPPARVCFGEKSEKLMELQI